MKDNTRDKEVSNLDGTLKDIPPGSFREEWDKLADEILKSAVIKESDEPSNQNPYFADDLILQYEFFRKEIYEPKRVFYPCCNLDVSPIKGFPNSQVILVDNEKGLGKIMKKNGILQFTESDALTYVPERPFDLVIALNPCLSSEDLTKHLISNGYILANNWHNNATQLVNDPNFEGVGTIERNKTKIWH